VRDSTKNALIGAVALILAAVITGVFVYIARPSEKESNTSYVPQPSTSQPAKTVSSNQKQENNLPHKIYEAEAEIGEGKSYVDKETGFVFAVDQISKGLFGESSGVLCRYTLPDGTVERPYRRKVGHKVDFQYLSRKFFMVVEDVDYQRKVAKIRIRGELPL
jgi:hypothetical protein